MMKLIEQIKSDLEKAMKKKDETSILTYRGVLSALHNKEIELKKSELTDEEALGVVETQAKQRRDSINEFKKGKRDDLATKEEHELKLIEKYLPAKMTDDEAEKMIEEIIKKINASEMKDMGRVMGEVMKESQGKIDGATASRIVKEKLSG